MVNDKAKGWKLQKAFSKLVNENENENKNENDVSTNKILGSLEILAIKNVGAEAPTVPILTGLPA